MELYEVGNNHDSPEVLMKSIFELKNLESLSLELQKLSKNFCDRVSSNLLELKVLNLGGCANISESDLESLQKLAYWKC